MAKTSLILGIIGVVLSLLSPFIPYFCFVSLTLGVLALVFSIVYKANEKQWCKQNIAGLVLGIISIVFSVVGFILYIFIIAKILEAIFSAIFSNIGSNSSSDVSSLSSIIYLSSIYF